MTFSEFFKILFYKDNPGTVRYKIGVEEYSFSLSLSRNDTGYNQIIGDLPIDTDLMRLTSRGINQANGNFQ